MHQNVKKTIDTNYYSDQDSLYVTCIAPPLFLRGSILWTLKRDAS